MQPLQQDHHQALMATLTPSRLRAHPPVMQGPRTNLKTLHMDLQLCERAQVLSLQAASGHDQVLKQVHGLLLC